MLRQILSIVLHQNLKASLLSIAPEIYILAIYYLLASDVKTLQLIVLKLLHKFPVPIKCAGENNLYCNTPVNETIKILILIMHVVLLYSAVSTTLTLRGENAADANSQYEERTREL